MEGRRLLAGECGHAAPEVLGAAARRDRLGLELHLGLEALPRGLVKSRFAPPNAFDGPCASSRASASTALRSSASGTTRVTSPHSSASRAESTRLVK